MAGPRCHKPSFFGNGVVIFAPRMLGANKGPHGIVP